MTVATRASKGGQYGVNGEFYKGGEFLPSSTLTVKGEFSRTKNAQQAKPRKQEIALYKWEVSEQKSIWQAVGVGAYTKFHKTGYSKETGAQGTLETVETTPFWNNASQETQENIRELVTRWNNGERWI